MKSRASASSVAAGSGGTTAGTTAAAAGGGSGSAFGGIVMMDRRHNNQHNYNNDASPPVDDDDDFHEKQSKLERSSRQWLGRAAVLAVLLTTFALAVGQLHEQQRQKALAQASSPYRQQQQQQQQLHAGHAAANNVAVEEYVKTDGVLAERVKELDRMVRALKATPGVLMETDPKGRALTGRLQAATLELLRHRYGYGGDHDDDHPKDRRFRVAVEVVLPETVPDYDPHNAHGRVVIEMGPAELIPCSVFYFLELARTYRSGSFHRNAGHVLQAQAKATAVTKHMPFQEYRPEFPHKQYTAGYAGRPSGPGWYLSIQDNTRNHGPGSQQKENPNEADSLFGTIVEGVENGWVSKIHSVPQREWLDPKNHIAIPRMTILVPAAAGNNNNGHGGKDDHTTTVKWVPWTPPVALPGGAEFVAVY